MDKLGQGIADSIRNLEHIRDAQNPPNQDIVHQIDDLYSLAVKYAAASISEATPQYVAIADALGKAAQASLAAISDLSKVADAVDKTARAIKGLMSLIAAV